MRAGKIISVKMDLAVKTGIPTSHFLKQGETNYCQGHASERQETKRTDDSDRG